MEVELDHLIVPTRDKLASAKMLAAIFAVPWAETGSGPFSPVYLSDGLTLNFDQTTEPYPVLHYCFRVSETEFDAILGRLQAAGVGYRSNPHGEADLQVNTSRGGRLVYWNEPGGHVWEILTVSYDRRKT